MIIAGFPLGAVSVLLLRQAVNTGRLVAFLSISHTWSYKFLYMILMKAQNIFLFFFNQITCNKYVVL